MIYLPSTTSRMVHLLHYNYYYLLIYIYGTYYYVGTYVLCPDFYYGYALYCTHSSLKSLVSMYIIYITILCTYIYIPAVVNNTCVYAMYRRHTRVMLSVHDLSKQKKEKKKKKVVLSGQGGGYMADKIRGQLYAYTRGTSYIDRNAILRVGRPEALPLNVSGHGTNIIIRCVCVGWKRDSGISPFRIHFLVVRSQTN